eukprot:TRINITY_DN11356_c0_g1_i1.p1 TRINITY_DN11356_c0_g1~~TRINITY_DN11356_c0_g1_i1.p1  ORF type:complete len:516 (+),score=223.00 TRINITY_DN11356_c0_g1_i1:69-1550(+)
MDQRAYERNVQYLKELQSPSWDPGLPEDLARMLESGREDELTAVMFESYMENARAQRTKNIERLTKEIRDFEEQSRRASEQPRGVSPPPRKRERQEDNHPTDATLDRLLSGLISGKPKVDPMEDVEMAPPAPVEGRIAKASKRAVEAVSSLGKNPKKKKKDTDERKVEVLNKRKADTLAKIQSLDDKKARLQKELDQIDADLEAILGPVPAQLLSDPFPHRPPRRFDSPVFVPRTHDSPPTYYPRDYGTPPTYDLTDDEEPIYVPEATPLVPETRSNSSILSNSDYVPIDEEILFDPERLQREIEARAAKREEKQMEELKRLEARSLREEQERVFQESARLDRERQEAARAEAERAEKERQEELNRAEAVRKMKEEAERVVISKQEQRERDRLRDVALILSIPREEEASDPALVFTAGLTTPTARLRRRFLKSQPLKDIKTWACAELARDPEHYLSFDEFDLVDPSASVLSDLSLPIGQVFHTKGSNLNIQSR